MSIVEQQHTTCSASHSRLTRAEIVFVICVALAAATLRFAYPSRMAVEHFDEGVYASNFWFGPLEGHAYPDRHFYAPPLLPWLIEMLVLVAGPSHLATMGVSAVAGTLTVLLAWWAAREWFGREAGLAALVLVAASDFHVLYSRAALTDAFVCFWMLAAVYLFSKSCVRGSLRWAFVAGVAGGLGWWTKYNGWLSAAIALAGLLPWMLFPRRGDEPRPLRLIACWVVLAATMAAVWSPVLLALQALGGYTVVAANHRQFLQPLAEWFETLARQIANLGVLDGPLTAVGFGFAVLVPTVLFPLSRRAFTWNGPSDAAGAESRRASLDELQWNAVAAFLAAGAAALVPSCVVLGIAAAGGIVLQVVRAPASGQRLNAEPTGAGATTLPAWLLAAWFVGLLAATPFYTPYPRLTLPWLMSAWLGTAGLIGWWARTERPSPSATASESPSAVRQRGFTAVLILAALGVSGWLIAERFPTGMVGWQDRTGVERVAAEIVDAVAGPSGNQPREVDVGGIVRTRAVVYVYAEPAVFFHLSAMAADRIAAGPVTDLNFVQPRADRPPLPTYLITGPHAARTPQFASQWEQLGSRLELMGTYRYTPSDLVFLDQYDPRAFLDPSHRPEESIRLYRVR